MHNKIKMETLLIKTEKLSHTFNHQLVLDNISLEVPAGSIYGFLGPNGAGKTTTLRLLLGLLHKQSGSITVFGNDLSANRVNILKRIGSLIEQPSLYLHLSAKENLDVFRLYYNLQPSRLDEVLKTVGLADTGSKKVKAFSLGMKQRLAIAIALLHDPELLILDEPVNGLDPNGIIEIRQLLKQLNTEQGKTIIVSSHVLPEIERTATHVAIINKGKIVFQNTMDELRRLKSNQSVIEIEVDDGERAWELLRDAYAPSLQFNKLFIKYQSKQQLAAINALLTKEMVQVYGLAVMQNDLENLFIQLTSN